MVRKGGASGAGGKQVSGRGGFAGARWKRGETDRADRPGPFWSYGQGSQREPDPARGSLALAPARPWVTVLQATRPPDRCVNKVLS